MSAIENGGPAFPMESRKYEPNDIGQQREVKVFESGMTLRDYFAAHAPEAPDMQTFPIKQWKTLEVIELGDGMVGPRDVLRQESWAERSVRWSYEYADAMLAERKKP